MPTASARTETTLLPSRRILMITPSWQRVLSLHAWLSTQGHHVFVAIDPQQCFELLRILSFHLIVLDGLVGPNEGNDVIQPMQTLDRTAHRLLLADRAETDWAVQLREKGFVHEIAPRESNQPLLRAILLEALEHGRQPRARAS